MSSQTKSEESRAPHRLGLGDGTALYLGALLGPGVLALPALAAALAGPASVVAWAGLLALSVPVAGTFAALGIRFPGNGGVATFTGRAFGHRAATVVGWWFYFAVPLGIVSAALVGGEHIAAVAGLSRSATLAITCGLLLAAFVSNYAGLRFAGRLQLLLIVLLVGLIGVAILSAAPHGDPANFTPFLPHGWAGVAHAASVLFFAFAGWEAVSSLSGEFSDRHRQLPRVTALTLVVVTVVYLALSVTTIAVVGTGPDAPAVPLIVLLETGIGAPARTAGAALAAVLSLGAINTYLAGGARLGAALARDGGFPPVLKTHNPDSVPRSSLGALALLTGLVVAAVGATDLDLAWLMRATSACLAAVTFAGTAAAARLLTGRLRVLAISASGFTALILVFCGPFLLLPGALAVAALLALRRA